MVGGIFRKNLHSLDKDAIITFKFREWYSFLDMDNFNSDYLISVLTMQDNNGDPFLWTNVNLTETKLTDPIPIVARKQAEAVFNLSQLMFALYHGSVTACTFCDLQLNRLPRDIRKSGFDKLENCSTYSGTIFRKALHCLCWDIAENGGLPVIFSMMRNPILPIIRQKCLDALTNILCVDNIEKIVLERQPWFLEALISMVENGDLQCDMVPAISVLDRLVVVILSERMDQPYQQLMDKGFIEVCLQKLKSPEFNSSHLHLHFVKFQTIAMQAVALLCADEQSKNWPSSLHDLVFMYSYRSVLLWNTDSPPTDPIWHQSESFYRSMSFSSSALLFSFIILVHAILKWQEKSLFLKKQALVFKYQLSRLMTLQGFSSNNTGGDINYPVILNAVEWMWKTLYSTTEVSDNHDTNQVFPSILEPLPELCEKVLRYCSNRTCGKKENVVGQWKPCQECNITCYCSTECLKLHRKHFHDDKFCAYLSMKCNKFPSTTKRLFKSDTNPFS